ncbi:MAG TPA: ribosome small subunit-dependent GTPase A [Casimicrobiaceae bacterium]|nr:ribosome small subunit-dependent GTPase A [Casimicrobiaceae bacterium]
MSRADATRVGTPNGLVVAAHRRHYIVDLDGGDTIECVLKGRATTLACGDRVEVARDKGNGVIVALAPRRSLLYRSDAFKEKLVAANVTQVLAVVAPDVPVDEHLLNRWIIAAETERCRFVLVVNKSDLVGSDRFAQRFAPYAALGYPVVPVSAKLDAIPLAPWVRGQHSLIIGQSGMGKSTLINALLHSTQARTGELSHALHSGRHTTTAATLYRLPDDDGWLVDSPGMKVFGLAHCTREAITEAFVDLREIASQCRFRDCRHDREPDCAVTAAVAEGRVAPQRVTLLRTLLSETRKVWDPP